MSSVKKIEQLHSPVKREIAIDALIILFFKNKFKAFEKNSFVSDDNRKKFEAKFLELKDKFEKKCEEHRNDLSSRNLDRMDNQKRKQYLRDLFSALNWDHLITNNFECWSNYLDLSNNTKTSPDEMYERYIDLFKQSELRPLKMSYKNEWAYKGFVYGIQGHYSDDETRLLILEDFDKGRKYFEKLKAKFDESPTDNLSYDRPRIPENIRVVVWRRDSGKCARCDSREKLEYDHIVPISKGGSNTARNIELLCESCNRRKRNNVV